MRLFPLKTINSVVGTALILGIAAFSESRANECNLRDELAKIEAEFSPPAEGLPVGDLARVVRKESGQKGSNLVIWQTGEGVAALSPLKNAEYGVVEDYICRPDLAKKMGITVKTGPESKIRTISRGDQSVKYIDKVEVTLGDPVETNYLLEKNGFGFRYFSAKGVASEREILNHLADSKIPELPLSEEGGTLFHDRGVHHYELMPDELWPYIQKQAGVAREILDDPVVNDLLSKLPPRIREKAMKSLDGTSVTLYIEGESAQFSDLMRRNEDPKVNFLLKGLGRSARNYANDEADRVFLALDLASDGTGKASRKSVMSIGGDIRKRIKQIAKTASTDESDVNSILKRPGFMRRWRKELDRKLGRLDNPESSLPH